MAQKNQEGITVKKENFSEWFTQVIEKAEVVETRSRVKGFDIIRPWGAFTMENMFRLYEEELQKKGHSPTFLPSVIPEENLKKEASHIAGFTPEVFWLESSGKERLALRPTSETAYTPLFKLWVRSHRDLPLKLYQRGSVFRLDTKATRPLIRGREFIWIEAHDAFATKEEAIAQTQEDLDTSEKIMHQQFGIPFLPMKRPDWDKFAGAEWTIAADTILPNGRILQQPSTHLMGQTFSKAFGATFKNKKGEEDYIWTTAYGPAISRILVSVMAAHGDEKGLVLPFSITPLHVVIIPIFNKESEKKVITFSEKIKQQLQKIGLKVNIDNSEKRPGEKYYIWEMKGVPFRIEIGKTEEKTKSITIKSRIEDKKQKIKFKDLKKIKEMGKAFDQTLLKKADHFMKGKIINAKNKEDVKKIVDSRKIARANFCSVDKKGLKCAASIEKQFNVSIRGTMANKKETPKGNCIVCKEKAKEVVYIGKSY